MKQKPAELAYWLVTHLDEAVRIESETRLPANFDVIADGGKLAAVKQAAIRVAVEQAAGVAGR